MKCKIAGLYNPDLATLFIRIAVAAVFIGAGWMKITNIDAVISGFAMAGIAAPFAYIVAYAEFIGGLLILVGLFTQYAAIILGIVMIVAIIKVHWVNGFLGEGGYAYPLVLLLSCAALVCLSSGAYSLDKWCKSRCEKKAAVVVQ